MKSLSAILMDQIEETILPRLDYAITAIRALSKNAASQSKRLARLEEEAFELSQELQELRGRRDTDGI